MGSGVSSVSFVGSFSSLISTGFGGGGGGGGGVTARFFLGGSPRKRVDMRFSVILSALRSRYKRLTTEVFESKIWKL